MSQILSSEDQVTLSYMRQQKSNALMVDAVRLIERLTDEINELKVHLSERGD